MQIEFLQEKLKNCNLEQVARATDLSRPTLMRMRDGGNFTYANFQKVIKYFEVQSETQQKNKVQE